MESNGVRGRIHVSQATADALTARGKGNWLTPREDKIVAKGKGEMQTYFVTVSAGAGTVNTASVAESSDGDGPEEEVAIGEEVSGAAGNGDAAPQFDTSFVSV